MPVTLNTIAHTTIATANHADHSPFTVNHNYCITEHNLVVNICGVHRNICTELNCFTHTFNVVIVTKELADKVVL